MILEGTITRVLGTKDGVSQSGHTWKKAMYVLETNEKYPKRIAFSVFGEDKVNEMIFLPEQKVRLGVSIESKEWKGKWYTEVTCIAELETVKEEKPVEQNDAQPILEEDNELPFS